VVNAAAYTAVDAPDADAAYRALALLCAAADMPLIHVSTDDVFDGKRHQPATPYRETDPVNPQAVHGAGKLAGEEAVRRAGGKSIILRTARVLCAHRQECRQDS
jgi:dTDP-4-dehydrorhamnose reductase